MKFKLLATLLATTMASPALADVLVDNVTGITMDDDGSVKRFEAIVIDDDGRIAQVLQRGDKKPHTDFREDGRGRVMMPGFIDAHAHVMGVGFAAMTLDLSDTNSLEEALDKIRRFAAENDSRPWILGRGWNQEKWGLGRFPTAAELDSAVPDRPVYLQRVDGHARLGQQHGDATGRRDRQEQIPCWRADREATRIAAAFGRIYRHSDEFDGTGRACAAPE